MILGKGDNVSPVTLLTHLISCLLLSSFLSSLRCNAAVHHIRKLLPLRPAYRVIPQSQTWDESFLEQTLVFLQQPRTQTYTLQRCPEWSQMG